jgi:hypothetical protein
LQLLIADSWFFVIGVHVFIIITKVFVPEAPQLFLGVGLSAESNLQVVQLLLQIIDFVQEVDVLNHDPCILGLLSLLVFAKVLT